MDCPDPDPPGTYSESAMRLSVDQMEARDTPSQVPVLDPFGVPVPILPVDLTPLAAVVGWAGAISPMTPSGGN